MSDIENVLASEEGTPATKTPHQVASITRSIANVNVASNAVTLAQNVMKKLAGGVIGAPSSTDTTGIIVTKLNQKLETKANA